MGKKNRKKTTWRRLSLNGDEDETAAENQDRDDQESTAKHQHPFKSGQNGDHRRNSSQTSSTSSSSSSRQPFVRRTRSYCARPRYGRPFFIRGPVDAYSSDQSRAPFLPASKQQPDEEDPVNGDGYWSAEQLGQFHPYFYPVPPYTNPSLVFPPPFHPLQWYEDPRLPADCQYYFCLTQPLPQQPAPPTSPSSQENGGSEASSEQEQPTTTSEDGSGSPVEDYGFQTPLPFQPQATVPGPPPYIYPGAFMYKPYTYNANNSYYWWNDNGLFFGRGGKRRRRRGFIGGEGITYDRWPSRKDRSAEFKSKPCSPSVTKDLNPTSVMNVDESSNSNNGQEVPSSTDETAHQNGALPEQWSEMNGPQFKLPSDTERPEEICPPRAPESVRDATSSSPEEQIPNVVDLASISPELSTQFKTGPTVLGKPEQPSSEAVGMNSGVPLDQQEPSVDPVPCDGVKSDAATAEISNNTSLPFDKTEPVQRLPDNDVEQQAVSELEPSRGTDPSEDDLLANESVNAEPIAVQTLDSELPSAIAAPSTVATSTSTNHQLTSEQAEDPSMCPELGDPNITGTCTQPSNDKASAAIIDVTRTWSNEANSASPSLKTTSPSSNTSANAAGTPTTHRLHYEQLEDPLKCSKYYQLCSDRLEDESEHSSLTDGTPTMMAAFVVTPGDEIVVHEADSASECGSEDLEMIGHRYDTAAEKKYKNNTLSLAVELVNTKQQLPYDREFKPLAKEGLVNACYTNTQILEGYYGQMSRKSRNEWHKQNHDGLAIRREVADSGIHTDESADEGESRNRGSLTNDEEVLFSRNRGTDAFQYQPFGGRPRSEYSPLIYLRSKGPWQGCCCNIM